MAAAQSDAYGRGGAAHSQRPPGARCADRDARCRWRQTRDGRAREDDPRPARRRARPHCGRARLLLTNFVSPLMEDIMASERTKEKFIIEPHFRLQEWVAEEKGYFKDEGLDYVFQELIQ